MKISKREKVLLVLLLVAIVGYVYFNFFYLPLETEITDLESDLIVKETELTTLKSEMTELGDLEDRLEDQKKELFLLSNKYYNTFNQENFILLLNQIKDEDFKILSMDFDIEEDNENLREELEIKITYESSVESFYKFLDNVNKTKKDFNVKEVSIEAEGEKIVGEMALSANRILLSDLIEKDKSLIDELGKVAEKQFENPFVPYESLSNKFNNTDDELSKIELYSLDRDIQPIYDFDKKSLFFVGTDPEVTGRFDHSYSRLFGNISTEFVYNFGIMQEGIEANIAFADSIVIEEPFDYISLWLSSDFVSGHEIGIYLIDSVGQSFNIELIPNVDFKDWKVLEAELPLDMNYPCKVQRVYVASTENNQRLTGRLLFDRLQVANEIEEE